MVHAQKPDFVFRRNGRVHLNRRGRQFSRLLAAEVCASAVVMLDTPRSEVVWEYWLPNLFASFSFTPPPVRHRVPSGIKRTLTDFNSVDLLMKTNDKPSFEAQVWAQVSLYGIFGGYGIRMCFCPNTSVFLWQYLSTSVPYLGSSTIDGRFRTIYRSRNVRTEFQLLAA